MNKKARTEYFYPNEVDVRTIGGVRRAFLKPNWRDIRARNENRSVAIPEPDPKVVALLESIGETYCRFLGDEANLATYKHAVARAAAKGRPPDPT